MTLDTLLTSRRHVIQRVKPDKENAAKSRERFTRYVADFIESEKRELGIETIDSTRLETDIGARWGAFTSEREFLEHRDRLIGAFLDDRPQFLSLTFHLGDHILVPPYDNGWATGAGSAFSHFDGKMTIFGINGESSAGVSVILTSDVPAFVEVAPIGNFKYDASAFEHYPALRSRCGLGMLAYGDGPNPEIVRQVTIRDTVGFGAFQGISASGQISGVNMPSAPFGPVRYTPLRFHMQANKNYEFWFWAFLINAFPQANTAFISAFSVEVPLISVSASPPLILA